MDITEEIIEQGSKDPKDTEIHGEDTNRGVIIQSKQDPPKQVSTTPLPPEAPSFATPTPHQRLQELKDVANRIGQPIKHVPIGGKPIVVKPSVRMRNK